MSFLEGNDGVSLFYEEVGHGRPVIFLHGWAMSGRVWHFQRELADTRLVFLDLRGHGHSSTAGAYTLESYANDVAAVVERLDLHDPILVGWSMGAQVALQCAALLRARLAAMVLVGGTPRFTTAPDYEHGKAPVDVKGMGVRVRRDYQRTMGEFFRSMFAPDEDHGEQYQRIVHEIVMAGRSPDPAAVLSTLKILDTADLRPLLPEIDLPVLLVHGSCDSICPPSASRFMVERLPQATLHLMEGCGHAPFMTRPGEFNEVVRRFLEGLGTRR